MVFITSTVALTCGIWFFAFITVDYFDDFFPHMALKPYKGQQWGQLEQYLTFVNGLCDSLTVIAFTVHATNSKTISLSLCQSIQPKPTFNLKLFIDKTKITDLLHKWFRVIIYW